MHSVKALSDHHRRPFGKGGLLVPPHLVEALGAEVVGVLVMIELSFQMV